MKFSDIKENNSIYLYCGDMNRNRIDLTGIPFIGLSLYRDDPLHIKSDITKKIDLYDNSVDVVQSEDVFEHVSFFELQNTLSEIHRILKPKGYLRLSVPDYRCNLLYDRSMKDDSGNIVFDAGGGGNYDGINKKVINGGHVWFPKYESVKKLIDDSPFEEYKFFHYYDESFYPVINKIDYMKGYVYRTPDHDRRVQYPKRPMSIVVDCFKT